MISRRFITGLVLAGGQASRMQVAGEPLVDKGLLELHGLPLVAHAQRYLEPRVGRVCISANHHLDLYARYGKLIVDSPAFGNDMGPLAGIASALAQASTPWLMVIPVDVPNLPDNLVSVLVDCAIKRERKIVYAATERAHPLCMLVHRDLSGSLVDFLQSGERKVQLWQRRNGAEEVVFAGESSAFFNINTPQDLLLAQTGPESAAGRLKPET